MINHQNIVLKKNFQILPGNKTLTLVFAKYIVDTLDKQTSLTIIIQGLQYLNTNATIQNDLPFPHKPLQ